MKYLLSIYRQKDRNSEGRFQEYTLETDDESMTVAQALRLLNREHPDDLIRFESSCLQKKCGACAMVINNVPSLACDSVLKKIAKKKRVRIEPLRKFPIVADLIVDRNALFENLEAMRIWAKDDIELEERRIEFAYKASGCLQCGCCLEVCPNFYCGGDFFGMAAMAPSARLITSIKGADHDDMLAEYKKHIYDGCGKSLACRNICPAKLDIDHLMSRSNAAVLWQKIRR